MWADLERETMQNFIPYTLDLRGRAFSLSQPKVMGILNVTPDSFFSASRTQTINEIEKRIRQIVTEGASIIDIGAYSSRPNAEDISTAEEMKRLRQGLDILRKLYPEAIVSVDTFRADIAKMCVEEYNAQIVNDISGGKLDSRMFKTVAQLGVPYILMHMKGTPQTMQQAPYYGNVVKEVCSHFQGSIHELQDAGVKDIILDPGFGFGKTLEHNYQLLHDLEELHQFHLPLLTGFSRKSMIWKPLGITPEEALNGTTVLNTISLLKGVHILRVHDVKECIEVVKLTQALKNNHV